MVREHSERLLELHPESTVALEGLAAWASATEEHGLTAKFCTLLVSAMPGHFEGWFNLKDIAEGDFHVFSWLLADCVNFYAGFVYFNVEDAA